MTDISENNKDRNKEKGRWVMTTWKGYSISWQWELLSDKTDWIFAHRASAAWAHVQYAQVFLPTPNTHTRRKDHIQKEGSCTHDLIKLEICIALEMISFLCKDVGPWFGIDIL